MPARTILRLIFIILLLRASQASAQNLPPEKRKVATYNYDFVRGENVVFFDDFNGYEEGAFPLRWGHLTPQPGQVITTGKVATIDGRRCYYFKPHTGVYTNPLWDVSEYRQHANNYWSIEFDFKLIITPDRPQNGIGIYFEEQPTKQYLKWVNFSRTDTVSNMQEGIREDVCDMFAMVGDPMRPDERARYPSKFDFDAWHHFSLAITVNGVSAYIDSFKFITVMPEPVHIPAFAVNGQSAVAFCNFMLARTDSAHPKVPEAQTSVNALLTEKKFVTHAITFDKNKADIKPQSLDIINQLATFLKANPAVKLQINGHTDSDGKPSANIVLSLRRAEAIKKKLVVMGISEGRLQVKGFGATQPLSSNSTPAGMAENRRVEFVRL